MYQKKITGRTSDESGYSKRVDMGLKALYDSICAPSSEWWRRDIDMEIQGWAQKGVWTAFPSELPQEWYRQKIEEMHNQMLVGFFKSLVKWKNRGKDG